MVNMKNMVNNIKEKIEENKQERSAKAEAERQRRAAEEEAERQRRAVEMTECRKHIIHEAKTLSNEYNITFLEALEVIKMVDDCFNEAPIVIQDWFDEVIDKLEHINGSIYNGLHDIYRTIRDKD